MILPHLIVATLAVFEIAWAATERPASCLAVHGESILAGDLAAANPVFASLDPTLVMGSAPMAGARRDFHRQELAALARRHNLSATALKDVCFEWPARDIAPQDLAAAMARVLECDPGAVEVVEQSRFPAPPGELVFAREALALIPGTKGQLQLWRGFVRYGANRRFPLRARVRIALPAVRVVAVATLLPGRPIEVGQLEQTIVTGASVDGVFAASVKDVAGRVPITRIEPGTAIRNCDLKVKPEILAGDEVQVEVRNGGMRVYAVARAEQSGRLGDMIPLTNLQSSAHFRARVAGQDRVSLTVRPGELP